MDERTALLQESGQSRAPTVRPEITGTDSEPTVKCQVCSTIIPIGNKAKQLVVKCPQCNEATPIKGAPSGKQYVRCPCNCLLICKTTATRVGCPRENCRSVISLPGPNASAINAGDSFVDPNVSRGGTFPTRGSLRVTCGNCHRPFSIPIPQNYRSSVFETIFLNRIISCLSGGSASNMNSLIAARCPQCHKITSIGQPYARTRWVAFLILALIFLVIAVGVTIGTAAAAKSHHGLYFLWSVLYLAVLLCAIRSYMCFRMPISALEIPVTRA